MSLRWRIPLLLAVVFALLSSIAYGVQKWFIFPRFVELERHQAFDDYERCSQALQREVDHLSLFCGDWAAWDDAYAFIEDGNPAFTDTNLAHETLVNNRLAMLLFRHRDGRVVWPTSAVSDPNLAMNETETRRLLADHPALTALQEPNAVCSGLVLTSAGPMLIVARPIVTSKTEGPVRGVLLMGRLLSPDRMTELASQTRVKLDSWVLSDNLPGDLKEQAAKAGRTRVCSGSAESLYVHGVYPDVSGRPAMLFRVTSPREITRGGKALIDCAVGVSIGCGSIVLLLMFFELNRTVLRPILLLTDHTVEVGRRENWDARLEIERSDEIGILAGELNSMIARLRDAHRNMLDVAHQAGMAEIASEVLHNAGNALNTANTSAELLEQRLAETRLPGLTKAAGFLEDHRHEVERALARGEAGKRFLGYIRSLANVLEQEHGELTSEVRRLRDKLNHVIEVIALQQNYADRPRLVQTVDVVGIVEDTLRMNAVILERSGIEIVRDYRPVPGIPVEKSRLMQVMLNLIKNAKESLDLVTGPRRLTIRVRAREDACVVVEVEDTGAGIAVEKRPLVFHNGFTTKAAGKGIGLHFCSNAMNAMGGGITFTTDGEGKGARFTFWLPAPTQKVTQDECTEAGGEPADSDRG